MSPAQSAGIRSGGWACGRNTGTNASFFNPDQVISSSFVTRRRHVGPPQGSMQRGVLELVDGYRNHLQAQPAAALTGRPSTTPEDGSTTAAPDQPAQAMERPLSLVDFVHSPLTRDEECSRL